MILQAPGNFRLLIVSKHKTGFEVFNIFLWAETYLSSLWSFLRFLLFQTKIQTQELRKLTQRNQFRKEALIFLSSNSRINYSQGMDKCSYGTIILLNASISNSRGEGCTFREGFAPIEKSVFTYRLLCPLFLDFLFRSGDGEGDELELRTILKINTDKKVWLFRIKKQFISEQR